MIESWFQLDNIEDDSLLFGTDYDEPRLFFNKTTKFGFEYPARFNKTSVALLSGAILFVLINTAFLIMYINSKQPAPTKKPKQYNKGNSSSNERKDKDEKFIYEEYYEYYYEDLYHDNSSRIDENPR